MFLILNEVELFDCEECVSKKLYFHRNCPLYPAPRDPRLKYNIADRFEIPICPRGFFETHKDLIEIMDLWHFYRKGHLPYYGGALDQEYYLMVLFRILDEEEARIMRKEIDGRSQA